MLACNYGKLAAVRELANRQKVKVNVQNMVSLCLVRTVADRIHNDVFMVEGVDVGVVGGVEHMW